MYAGVILYRFKPEHVEEAVRVFREMVLPQARKQKGFIKAEMFADRETGRAMDIGYWQTKEDASNFEKSGAYGFLISSLEEFLEVKPQRMQFEKVHLD